MPAEVAGEVWLQQREDTGLETVVNLFSASALLLSAGVALCGRVLCTLGYPVACPGPLSTHQLWLSVQVSTSGINTDFFSLLEQNHCVES